MFVYLKRMANIAENAPGNVGGMFGANRPQRNYTTGDYNQDADHPSVSAPLGADTVVAPLGATHFASEENLTDTDSDTESDVYDDADVPEDVDGVEVFMRY